MKVAQNFVMPAMMHKLVPNVMMAINGIKILELANLYPHKLPVCVF